MVWAKKSAALVGLAILLGGTYWCVRQLDRSALAPPVVATPALVAGDLLHFRVDETGRLADRQVQLSGELQLAILAPKDRHYLALIWFIADAAARPPELADLLPAIQRGALVELSRTGFRLQLAAAKSAEFAWPQAQAQAERAFWQGLFQHWAFAVGQDSEIDGRFTGEETTATGETVATSFAMAPPCKDGGSVRANKFWFSSTRSVTGRSSASLLPGCQVPQSITSESTDRVAAGQAQLTATTSVQLHFTAKEHLSPDELAELKARFARLPPTSLAAAKPASPSNSIDQAVVGTLDEGQLLALLRQAGDAMSSELYLQLKSWLALHPESIAPLCAWLNQLAPDDSRLRGGIKALAAVGTPQAQDALVELMASSRQDPAVRGRIATSLAFVPLATPAATAAVLSLAESANDPLASHQAKLAIGIIGSRLRATDDIASRDRAAALEDRLDHWLQNAGDPTERATALAALGNFGPANLSALDEWRRSADPKLRGQAYFALRFAPGTEAAKVLAQAAASEQDPAVKSEVARSQALRRAAGLPI